jgi:hypothetical protein
MGYASGKQTTAPLSASLSACACAGDGEFGVTSRVITSPKRRKFFMVEANLIEDYSMMEFALLLELKGLQTIGLTLFTP